MHWLENKWPKYSFECFFFLLSLRWYLTGLRLAGHLRSWGNLQKVLWCSQFSVYLHELQRCKTLLLWSCSKNKTAPQILSKNTRQKLPEPARFLLWASPACFTSTGVVIPHGRSLKTNWSQSVFLHFKSKLGQMEHNRQGGCQGGYKTWAEVNNKK